MIPSSVTSRASTINRRWAAGLLVAAGAAWLLLELLDLPTQLGWYGLGATPTGLQCTLAALVAVSVTVVTATHAITAPRPLLAMLVVIVWLRVAGRTIPLLGHADRGLDTSASTALISTGVLGTIVAVTVVMVVAATVTRRTLSSTAVLVVVALVATTIHGLGVPTAVQEVTAGVVAAAYTVSGILVLRRGSTARSP